MWKGRLARIRKERNCVEMAIFRGCGGLELSLTTLSFFLSLFLKILFLNDLYTHRGARTQDPKIKELYVLPTEPTRHPMETFLIIQTRSGGITVLS